MILCLFLETSDGYKHIVATERYLPKYVVVRALKIKTTDEGIRETLNWDSQISFNMHAYLVPVVNSVTISSQDFIDAEEAIISHYDPLLNEFRSDDIYALPDPPG